MADRVLVVEDNPLNRKLIRDVLEFAGFEVSVASTGEEGLVMAGDRPPDLVLMDLQLPGIDGVETLRRLRDLPRSREIPVVAVTAFAMKHDRERASEQGFDGYLGKPLDVRALPAQVQEYLRRGVAGR
jgi:two-component system cell cycle response regulator DivK